MGHERGQGWRPAHIEHDEQAFHPVGFSGAQRRFAGSFRCGTHGRRVKVFLLSRVPRVGAMAADLAGTPPPDFLEEGPARAAEDLPPEGSGIDTHDDRDQCAARPGDLTSVNRFLPEGG